jgi:hypothetical protein
MPTLSADDQRRNEFVNLVKYRPVRGDWACLDDCANRDGFVEGDVVEVTGTVLACSIRVATGDATLAPSRLSSPPLTRTLTIRRSSSRPA